MRAITGGKGRKVSMMANDAEIKQDLTSENSQQRLAGH